MQYLEMVGLEKMVSQELMEAMKILLEQMERTDQLVKLENQFLFLKIHWQEELEEPEDMVAVVAVLQKETDSMGVDQTEDTEDYLGQTEWLEEHLEELVQKVDRMDIPQVMEDLEE
jgi:hypothetical protein